MDTISNNTSGATYDTLHAAFEAAMRDAGWTNVDPGSWFGYRAGYEHAIRDAAATVDAMITSPTDIILCADTIDEAAARIRRLGAK